MGTIIIFLFFLFISSITPSPAYSQSFSLCGEYELDGEFSFEMSPLSKKNKQKIPAFILEKGGNSEIKIFLSPKNFDEKKITINRPVRAIIKMLSKCTYYCEGELLSLSKYLSPFEEKKSNLFPRPIPIQNGNISCQKNSFETFLKK